MLHSQFRLCPVAPCLATLAATYNSLFEQGACKGCCSQVHHTSLVMLAQQVGSSMAPNKELPKSHPLVSWCVLHPRCTSHPPQCATFSLYAAACPAAHACCLTADTCRLAQEHSQKLQSLPVCAHVDYGPTAVPRCTRPIVAPKQAAHPVHGVTKQKQSRACVRTEG